MRLEDLEATLQELRKEMSPHLAEASAARDRRFTTDFLFSESLKCVIDDFEGHEGPCSPALLVLQKRTRPEVLKRLYDSLESPDRHARMLALRVLREFPGLDAAPHAHSEETVRRVARLLRDETEEDLVAWGLATIAWQRLDSGVSTLLSFRKHPSPWVRDTVADCLLMHLQDDESLSDEVVTALLELAQDPEAEVRWSALYEVRESLGLFRGRIDELQSVAEVAVADPDGKVAGLAAETVEAIRAYRAEVERRGRNE